MACSTRALEFAHRRLAALTVMSGLEKAEIYDRFYEGVRHAIIMVHAFSPRTFGCSAFAPVGFAD